MMKKEHEAMPELGWKPVAIMFALGVLTVVVLVFIF
jgi:hypothetical protein